MDATCSGERGNGPSQGLVSGSYSFGDLYTSELNQAMYPTITYVPNNTTRNAELGSAQVDDARIGLLWDAAQEARAPANETRYTNCSTTRCLYPGAEGMLCLQWISCATVPSHFADHGIENKSRAEMIRCKWKGCVSDVTRHAFARHIREVHLRHLRGTSAHRSENDTGQQT
ncbi:hypothetical protein EDD17DRAFT_549334 [Pisolithus thermaeus]|nr:hypothetical protein EDD17DRAFT_549334 [Pisolithus thermaeus]